MNYSVCKDFYLISSDLDKENQSYIYGEVNPKEILDIIKNFNYQGSSFLDIGSGCGKIILSLASELKIFCTGVEIDKLRFNKSLSLLENMDIFEYVDFINKDFKDIYFGKYDIIYCCNTIFTKQDNKKLYNKILQEFNGYLFLFNYDHTLKKYLILKENIKTSWSKHEKIYVFFIN